MLNRISLKFGEKFIDYNDGNTIEEIKITNNSKIFVYFNLKLKIFVMGKQIKLKEFYSNLVINDLLTYISIRNFKLECDKVSVFYQKIKMVKTKTLEFYLQVFK